MRKGGNRGQRSILGRAKAEVPQFEFEAVIGVHSMQAVFVASTRTRFEES
jgi:hypothetical protein